MASIRVNAPEVIPSDGALCSSVAKFFFERGIAAQAALRRAKPAQPALGLSWPEFRNLLAAEGCLLAEPAARRAFRSADADGDGFLGRREWVRLLTPPSEGGPSAPGGVWRRCQVLPGYCAAAGSHLQAVHEFCGSERVNAVALALPALEDGMTHGAKSTHSHTYTHT